MLIDDFKPITEIKTRELFEEWKLNCSSQAKKKIEQIENLNQHRGGKRVQFKHLIIYFLLILLRLS